MKYPLLFKALMLGFVVVVLNLGLSLVGNVATERHERQLEAEASVVESLAGRQTLLGPVLQRVCSERWEVLEGSDKDRKTVAYSRDFTLLAMPSDLKVNGGSVISPLSRGLFKVNTHASHAKIDATWNSRAELVPAAQYPKGQVHCAPAAAVFVLSDPRGLRSAALRIEGVPVEVAPQALDRARGLGAEVPDGTGPLAVSLDVDFAGTRSIAWVPIGNQTTVSWASPWTDPSFAGRSPDTRVVDHNGFQATWKVSALATTAQRTLKEGGAACTYSDDSLQVGTTKCIDAFGVNFINTVDLYVLSDRAIKYGLLFIVLTLGGVALTEILRRVRVHPVQYLLVGAALTVFFLLLLSLSEQLSFDLSYLIASGACTALLTFYARYVLKGLRAAIAMGASVALLYGALFALLKMERDSLVVGSTMLFVVLAGVMIFTRKIDWYTVARTAQA